MGILVTHVIALRNGVVVARYGICTIEDMHELVKHRSGDSFAVLFPVEKFYAENIDLKAIFSRGQHGVPGAADLKTAYQIEHPREIALCEKQRIFLIGHQLRHGVERRVFDQFGHLDRFVHGRRRDPVVEVGFAVGHAVFETNVIRFRIVPVEPKIELGLLLGRIDEDAFAVRFVLVA